MKKNIGTTDRVLRIIAALIVVTLYFTGQISGTAAIVLLIISAVFIFTSFISFCPLYALFGFSTRTRNNRQF